MINIRELGSVKLGVLTSFLLGFLVAITAGHTGLAFAQSRNNVDMNSIVPTLMMLLEEPDGESVLPTPNGIPIISRLNLIGYNDGDSSAVNLGQLRNGQVINLASLTVDEINIEAVSATTSLSESVSFTLSGADVFTRTDNDMTFTLKDSRDRFDLSESELSEGVYNLTVTAYNDINGAGIAGDAYTISFTVVDPTQDPTRPNISSFDLIGVDANGRVTTIKSINNSETINLSSISSPKINFYAVPTNGDIVKSIHFLLTGPLTLDRVENVAPYSLAFDGNHLDIENDGLPVGDYSLVITPYSDRNRQGDAGNVLTLSFSVEEGDTQPTPDVANLAGVDLLGDNNRVIRRLTDGASIDLRLIASSTVSFSAVPSQNSQTESVSLSLIGPVTLNQTLNAPQLTTQAFNVAADGLPAGLYNLQLTPYTGRDASGDVGDLVTIEFRVIRSNDSEPTPPLAGIPEVVLSYPSGIHEPGKLLYRNVGLGRITNIIYHNGVVYTHNVAAGNRREWRWSNKNDINSFGIVKEGNDVPAPTDHGTHGYNKIGDWVAGTYGPLIQRVSPGVNASPFLGGERHPDWVGTPDDTQIYWPWSLPFSWIQYDSDDNKGSFIRRFDKELARWDSLEDHGVTGNTILIGNILLVTSDETANGILSYDISPIFETPSRPPVLLDKLGGNIGAYIAVPWRNYIIMARRDSQSIDVVDYSDPTNLRFVTSISTTTDPDKNAGGNVPYTQAQDEFIFAMRHKINMETFEKVLELDEVGGKRPAGSESGPLGTSQFLLPVGQYLLTGAYSSGGRDGMGIWAHQREPDTRGPFVGYHIPRQGQKNYPTQAPISVLIHETLESYTIINGQTVIVRPVGGEPVEAYVSFSYTDVLTITPKEPLLENTSYEVVFPEGGIRDAANNGMQAYSFSFSTGDSVLAGNRSPDISAVITSKDGRYCDLSYSGLGCRK